MYQFALLSDKTKIYFSKIAKDEKGNNRVRVLVEKLDKTLEIYLPDVTIKENSGFSEADVKYHIKHITSLKDVIMEVAAEKTKIAETIKRAKEHLDIAEFTFNSFKDFSQKPYEVVCNHAAISADFIIKAAIDILLPDEKIPNSHNLAPSLKILKKNGINYPKKFNKIAKTFKGYSVEIRYNNAAEKYLSDKHCKRAIKNAKEIFNFMERKIKNS